MYVVKHQDNKDVKIGLYTSQDRAEKQICRLLELICSSYDVAVNEWVLDGCDFDVGITYSHPWISETIEVYAVEENADIEMLEDDEVEEG